MSKTSSVIKPLSGVKKYLSIQFRRLIVRYEDLMSKKFPSTYRMLQMFTCGTRDFSKDVFQYMKISKDLTFSLDSRDLTYRELMVYMQTPKDMRKMAPFLVITAIPFAQYVTLPVAFLFPKQLLSFHYWNLEQRSKFALNDHTRKLYYYRPVFRQLQKRLDSIEEQRELFGTCRDVFAKLGSGTHPSVSKVAQIKPLFSGPPYALEALSHQHLILLCKMHGLSLLIGKRNRLKNHIRFIQELDNAWLRDQMDHNSSLEELKKRTACLCYFTLQFSSPIIIHPTGD